MSLVVIGSVGIDDIETPHVKRAGLLGGSAAYAAYSAGYFVPTKLVGVVGHDFPAEHRSLLEKNNVDLAGLEVADGKTFRWSGKYHEDMNNRDTLHVELNVLGTFDPKLPAHYRNADFLFLGNAVPAVQHKVLRAMERRPKFVGLDTMNLWIEIARGDLDALLAEVDTLILNDGEARQYTDERELIVAGNAIRQKGPKTVIIKKGEHGALVVSEFGNFAVPAYPLEKVVDPTGAGDTFAGAIFGYIAAQGKVDPQILRRAVLYGSTVASFTCEDLSLDRLEKINRVDIDARFQQLLEMTRIP